MVDDPVVNAVGKALALFARVFQRDGSRDVGEFADLLALLGVLAAETDPREGDILAVWAVMVSNAPERRRTEAGPPPG